ARPNVRSAQSATPRSQTDPGWTTRFGRSRGDAGFPDRCPPYSHPPATALRPSNDAPLFVPVTPHWHGRGAAWALRETLVQWLLPRTRPLNFPYPVLARPPARLMYRHACGPYTT